MLNWQEVPQGFREGRYEIVREAPLRWQLVVSGRLRSWHATASAAKVEAERLERLHRRNTSLLRIGVALGIVTGLLGVVWWFRMEVNPAREVAATLGARLDAAYRVVEGGTASVGDLTGTSDGVQGALVTLSNGEEITVLLGEAGGDCYALFWSPDRPRRARVLADGLPCEPAPIVASTNQYSYKRETPAWSWHLGWVQGEFDWTSILPPATQQRLWFVPAVLLLAAVALALLTKASVIFLASRGRP